MKLLLLLTLLVGLAVALEFAELEDRQYKHRSHKKTSRPKKFSGATTMRASRKPSGAPPEYKTSTDKPSRKRSKATLKKLPSDLIDADLRRREESHRTLTLLRRQASVADYYECGSVSITLSHSNLDTHISIPNSPSPDRTRRCRLPDGHRPGLRIQRDARRQQRRLSDLFVQVVRGLLLRAVRDAGHHDRLCRQPARLGRGAVRVERELGDAGGRGRAAVGCRICQCWGWPANV